ncbi:hypothetical protein [Caballeronia sp. Lep1P3]|uniref:hypothetical protein n=1 Tax=Caballeronia sp. Lep1P3 TaxID=2878150 RepID=UPI001FD16765|nr:hypothetical protein [Caballeronia sp. Lep1P3]
MKLFTAASGLLRRYASPAPHLPGDSWLLVVTAGVSRAGFSRGKPSAHEGMSFVPRTPAVFAGPAFQTAHAVSPMPLTLAKSERCLICAFGCRFAGIHQRKSCNIGSIDERLVIVAS